MRKIYIFTFLLFFIFFQLNGQGQPLSYYLPEQPYGLNIPSPESILGYEVGEWHVSHDQLNYYMHTLAAASDRIELQEYGRSHEGRPLILLTISSKQNLAQIEDIKKQHQQLSDPEHSAKVNIEQMPSVILQGYSVHGNEASGSNAALLIAYHLAASQSEEVEQLLNNVIILLDPCFNPDGMHRFSTWVNSHKSKHPVTNPDSREFREVWPGGRTNHYWFDLNRDWLLAVHPESQGRLKIFHDWLPNILTDHHEMGSNATFFFQPGIPSRTNPITPQKNQDLTKQIGSYHAAALDAIGSLYYSEESYDDFYYGKGSTYPDVNGSIGILFEQASSRGHLRDTDNGLLTFPFTIRNQVRASLSTQKAALEMRKELLAYQRDFYQNAKQEVTELPHAAYIFGESHDNNRLAHFVELLNRHQIEVYALGQSMKSKGIQFQKGRAYIVPLAQRQSRLIQSIFEKRTEFRDSLFYDVSAWTLPLAFNLNYTTIDTKTLSKKGLGKRTKKHDYTLPKLNQSDYAYLMEWDDYYAPKALNQLLQKGIRVKVADDLFSMPIGPNDKAFQRGTILIPVQNQYSTSRSEEVISSASMFQIIKDIAAQNKLTIHAVNSGWTPEGIDLGSNKFRLLRLPEVLLVAGKGASSYEVGEVWHLLDQRFEMPPVIVPMDQFGRLDLKQFTNIVMVSGSYKAISSTVIGRVKKWLKEGGVLTCSGSSIRWAQSNGLANVTFKNTKSDNSKNVSRRPYAMRSPDIGANVIGGAILQAELDLTHPLAYGFRKHQLPVFRRGTIAMNLGKNPYSTPAIYSSDALLSGYASQKNLNLINKSAAISVTGQGRGRVICIADNMNFRGFWYGTNKVFMNSLFFGHLISGQAVEAAPIKK